MTFIEKDSNVTKRCFKHCGKKFCECNPMPDIIVGKKVETFSNSDKTIK